MICLVEGLDRTGKGTLCARLQKDLPGFQYVHFGVPDRVDPYDFFMEKLTDVQGNLIIDRLHWSNAAYNGCLGGPVLVDFDWWRIDHWIAEQPSVAVLLVDDPHAICQRLQQEETETPARRLFVSPREVAVVQSRFYQCFDRSGIRNRWSLGLDQLLTPADYDGVAGWECTPVYDRLLAVLQEQEVPA